MEEKELPFEYKNMEEEVKSFNIDMLKKEVFGTTAMHKGSGEMVALKLVLQSLDNIVLVSSGIGSVIARTGINVPFVNVSSPIAFARGAARSVKNAKIVVFAGEGTTMKNLPEIMAANENILYICYNNRIKQRQLARMMPGYAATASIAFYEDFIIKLKKAFANPGFSYIEILTPNPSWGYDPSNTIEIAKTATECLLWPIYESVDGSVTITKRPEREEPVSRFFSSLKTKVPEKEMQALQEAASRNWKSINKTTSAS